MKLDATVHTALDELRMQMLGTQVLFGFQFQGIFQEGFEQIAPSAKLAALSAFGLIVLTFALLVAPAAQHRLVENGVATRRILRVAGRFAELALATYAGALGCDLYAVMESYFGSGASTLAAGAAVVVVIVLWYGLGLQIREGQNQRRCAMPNKVEPALHEKIDQMLTEARVILPGAQALLGFQFIVTMTKGFQELPDGAKDAHFLALFFVLLAIALLISPAAVHRLGFFGEDDERVHRIGSVLVTAALVPLAAGIATDLYVAVGKAASPDWAVAGAIAAFILFAVLWYAVPLLLRARWAGAGKP